jgi:FkbM family methyltransferase
MGEYSLIDGDWWPSYDTVCRQAAYKEVGDLHDVIKYCKHKRVVVQAGGNCGIWPRELSRHFQWVYTFEPDPDNFHCLARNAIATNIIKFQAALGSEHKTIAMRVNNKNAGSLHMEEVAGSIPVLRIDDLNLPACDFIELDLEGYELFALRGAEETIMRHRPVLMIEHKLHAVRYGERPEAVLEFLIKRGYKAIRKLHSDLILIHEGAQ